MTDKKVEFDKSPAGFMLGRRISGIVMKRRKPGVEKVVENRIFFMFDDGSGFEMFCAGDIVPDQVEAYDANSLLSKSADKYDNEFVAVSNEDGEGYSVLFNKPAIL